MPGDEFITKQNANNLDALNLEGYDKIKKQQEELKPINGKQMSKEESDRMIVQKQMTSEDMAQKAAQMSKQHREDMQKQTVSLTNTAQTLIAGREGLMKKSFSRLDEYVHASNRYYNIVKTLDFYLESLDKTGMDGSDDYMLAKQAILNYKEIILKIDGNPAFENSSIILENSYMDLQNAVQGAITSYEERGIKSIIRRGGVRKRIFEIIRGQLSRNEENPNESGSLYKSFLSSKLYEAKREQELTNGELSVNPEIQAEYKETKNKLLSLYNETQDLANGKEKDQKLAALEEKRNELSSSYVKYLNGVETLNTPPITRLQKETMERRIKRWKKIENGCQITIKHVPDGVDPADVTFHELRLDTLQDGITRLAEHIPNLEQRRKNAKLDTVLEMLTDLQKLNSIHQQNMNFMDKNASYFRKGNAASLENAYDKALNTVKTVIKNGSKGSDSTTIRIAKEMKDSLEKGEIGSAFAELIQLSSITESKTYESREDIEKPLSDADLKQYTKSVDATDLEKDPSTMSNSAIIRLLARTALTQDDFDEVAMQYDLNKREKTMQGASKQVLKAFDQKSNSLNKASENLSEAIGRFSMLRKTELAMDLLKLQRKVNYSFLMAYNNYSSIPGHPLSRQEKVMVKYNLLMNTELGKACKAINGIVSRVAMDAGSIGSVFQWNFMGDRVLETAEEGVNINLFNLDYSDKFDAAMGGANWTSVKMMLEKGGAPVKVAERARVDKALDKMLKGMNFKAQDIALFKGDNHVNETERAAVEDISSYYKANAKEFLIIPTAEEIGEFLHDELKTKTIQEIKSELENEKNILNMMRENESFFPTNEERMKAHGGSFSSLHLSKLTAMSLARQSKGMYCIKQNQDKTWGIRPSLPDTLTFTDRGKTQTIKNFRLNFNRLIKILADILIKNEGRDEWRDIQDALQEMSMEMRVGSEVGQKTYDTLVNIYGAENLLKMMGNSEKSVEEFKNFFFQYSDLFHSDKKVGIDGVINSPFFTYITKQKGVGRFKNLPEERRQAFDKEIKDHYFQLLKNKAEHSGEVYTVEALKKKVEEDYQKVLDTVEQESSLSRERLSQIAQMDENDREVPLFGACDINGKFMASMGVHVGHKNARSVSHEFKMDYDDKIKMEQLRNYMKTQNDKDWAEFQLFEVLLKKQKSNDKLNEKESAKFDKLKQLFTPIYEKEVVIFPHHVGNEIMEVGNYCIGTETSVVKPDHYMVAPFMRSEGLISIYRKDERPVDKRKKIDENEHFSENYKGIGSRTEYMHLMSLVRQKIDEI